MVPPSGIAPQSSAYQAGAQRSSYEGSEKWSRAPVLPRVPPRSKRGGFADSLARASEKWLRRPDSNRRYAAYETAALPLGYSAVIGKNVIIDGKMVRPAGLAPAFPEWKSGILLLDDDRIMKMKPNTAASPVMDSHPQENFSADLSVFQAHLPWQELYINKVMPKPLVCLSSRAVKIGTIQILQPVMIS